MKAKFVEVTDRLLTIVKPNNDEWQFVRTVEIEVTDDGEKYIKCVNDEDRDPWIHKIVLKEEPERKIFMIHLNDNGHGNSWFVEIIDED